METDPVDGNVLGFESFDEGLHGGGFGTGAFDVVVVDVEFGSGVGGASGLESDGDVACAEGVVEDVGPPCSVVVEWFWREWNSVRSFWDGS